MGLSVKMTISLPEDLVRTVERARKGTKETRSAFVRRAIEQLFAEESRKKKLAAYLDGYRRHPETPEEIAGAEAAARILAEEPW